MVDQAKAAGYIMENLAHEVANAKTNAERDTALKNAADSMKAGQMQQRADSDRLHEKLEGVTNNPEIMDSVHISPKAQALLRAHEAGLKGAPERVHEHLQTDSAPQEQKGPLGLMNEDG